jgi:hypothetical protein
MPLDWDILDSEERAQAILDNIEGLYDKDVAALLEDWKQGYFDLGDETLVGSLARLTQMAQDCVTKRSGLPSGRERARANLVRKGLVK